MTTGFIVGKRYRLVSQNYRGDDRAYDRLPIGYTFTVDRLDGGDPMWALEEESPTGQRYHASVCEPVRKYVGQTHTETLL